MFALLISNSNTTARRWAKVAPTAALIAATLLTSGCRVTVVESPAEQRARSKSDSAVVLTEQVKWRDGYCQSVLDIEKNITDVNTRYKGVKRPFLELSHDYVKDLRSVVDGNLISGLKDQKFDDYDKVSGDSPESESVKQSDKEWAERSEKFGSAVDDYTKSLDSLDKKINRMSDKGDHAGLERAANEFSDDVEKIVTELMSSVIGLYQGRAANNATQKAFASSISCQKLEKKAKEADKKSRSNNRVTTVPEDDTEK